MLYKIKLFGLHYKYNIKDNFSIVYKNLTSLLDNRENRDNIFEYKHFSTTDAPFKMYLLVFCM